MNSIHILVKRGKIQWELQLALNVGLLGNTNHETQSFHHLITPKFYLAPTSRMISGAQGVLVNYVTIMDVAFFYLIARLNVNILLKDNVSSK